MILTEKEKEAVLKMRENEATKQRIQEEKEHQKKYQKVGVANQDLYYGPYGSIITEPERDVVIKEIINAYALVYPIETKFVYYPYYDEWNPINNIDKPISADQAKLYLKNIQDELKSIKKKK